MVVGESSDTCLQNVRNNVIILIITIIIHSVTKIELQTKIKMSSTSKSYLLINLWIQS